MPRLKCYEGKNRNKMTGCHPSIVVYVWNALLRKKERLSKRFRMTAWNDTFNIYFCILFEKHCIKKIIECYYN